MASRNVGAISLTHVTVAVYLHRGLNSDIWSISCRAPRPCRYLKEENYNIDTPEHCLIWYEIILSFTRNWLSTYDTTLSVSFRIFSHLREIAQCKIFGELVTNRMLDSHCFVLHLHAYHSYDDNGSYEICFCNNYIANLHCENLDSTTSLYLSYCRLRPTLSGVWLPSVWKKYLKREQSTLSLKYSRPKWDE